MLYHNACARTMELWQASSWRCTRSCGPTLRRPLRRSRRGSTATSAAARVRPDFAVVLFVFRFHQIPWYCVLPRTADAPSCSVPQIFMYRGVLSLFIFAFLRCGAACRVFNGRLQTAEARTRLTSGIHSQLQLQLALPRVAHQFPGAVCW